MEDDVWLERRCHIRLLPPIERCTTHRQVVGTPGADVGRILRLEIPLNQNLIDEVSEKPGESKAPEAKAVFVGIINIGQLMNGAEVL